MAPPKPPDQGIVLIVGAGPTGLVLALWLTHMGAKVRIVDKTAEPGTTSRALGVQARTLEFYRQLGFADEAVNAGIRMKGLNFWVGGRKAGHVPLAEMGEGQTYFPFILTYPQDLHEKLLIAKLEEKGVRVERSTELLSFVDHGGGVKAVLRRPDASEEALEAAFLAGCDGASSGVRRAITPDFPGGTYSHVFYVADVDASGPATNLEIHIDLEPADFVAVFPLTRKGHVRVIGTLRDEVAGDREKLKFDDVRGTALRNLKLEVTRENWFSTYRVHHRVAPHFRKGRVFLLGDAAHLHSPVGAQGMNTGIGDAVNLSWKLAHVLAGRAPMALLDSYEPERISFARRLVATTDRIFTFVTKRGGLAPRVRMTVLPLLFPRLISIRRFRRFMFRLVSQIGLRYRESALSTGAAATVHGGDRLPWFRSPDGSDNHAPILGLAWSAHAYGEVPAGVAAACGELHIPLHSFAWDPAMAAAGLVCGALYVLRPDGYVAIADDRCTPERIRAYFRERGITPPG